MSAADQTGLGQIFLIEAEATGLGGAAADGLQRHFYGVGLDAAAADRADRAAVGAHQHFHGVFAGRTALGQQHRAQGGRLPQSSQADDFFVEVGGGRHGRGFYLLLFAGFPVFSVMGKLRNWIGLVLWLIWSAAAPAAQHGDELSDRVDSAIARGVEYLLPRQYADGSWRMAGHEAYTGGTTALACYALYKSGLPKEHAAVQLSLHFLKSDEPVHIYDAALRVLLLTSIDPVEYAPRIERAAAVLNYGPRQYFSYEADRGRDVSGDMSNHQYGLVGLEALDRFGFDSSEKFWIKASEFLIRQAHQDGGWGYYPNTDPNATMVLSGVASAACCLKVLQRNDWKPKLQQELQGVLAVALDRAEKNWFLDQQMDKAPLNRWLFYACYGVERAMAILQYKKLGELDWYPLIASSIVQRQRKNGSWGSAKGEPEMNTAFALLTLSRATASTGGSGKERELWRRSWSSKEEHAPVQVTASGLPQCSVFLTGFDREWLMEQTWQGESSPRILKVDWLLNGERIATVERSSTQWREDCKQVVPHRFSHQLSLPGNGTYVLQARLYWFPPPFHEVDSAVGPMAEDAEHLQSGEVEIVATGTVDDRVRTELDTRSKHAHPSRWSSKELKVRSSSAFGGERGAALAFDRCQATAWRWKADDGVRSLYAEWKQPFRANGMRLIPALPPDQSLDHYAMPLEIRLKVNGRKWVLLNISREDWHKGLIFPFRKTEKVRRIELEVTSIQKHRASGVGGISEIEFFGK